MKLATSLLLVLSLTASPGLYAQAVGRFAPYEHCRLPDGLTLLENNPLARGIQGRTVKTVMGTRDIPLTGGTRLLYGYPDTQPFASVKVEQIPAANYKQAKQDLIANFEQILTGTDPVTRNYTLKPRLNGAEIYGLDRTRLEGAVLGIYLFFQDRTHTAVTIDFLNQQPDERKFSTLEDYAPLRDTFISAYTHCATGGASAPGTTTADAASTSTAPLAAEPKPAVEAPSLAPLPDAPLPNGAAAAEAAPASTFVEPVAKPVTTGHTTRTTVKPATKRETTKMGAKPATKGTTNSASAKPAARSEKKPAAAKNAKSKQDAAKPRHKASDQD